MNLINTVQELITNFTRGYQVAKALDDLCGETNPMEFYCRDPALFVSELKERKIGFREFHRAGRIDLESFDSLTDLAYAAGGHTYVNLVLLSKYLFPK